MVKNKAKIAPESFYNPRASRALKRALDPGRKGLRARDVCFAHMRVRFFIFKCWQVCKRLCADHPIVNVFPRSAEHWEALLPVILRLTAMHASAKSMDYL